MKLSRRLIPAFAMLLVSAVLMSTASFAWFSMNSEVTANGMQVTATAESSLVIKANAGDFSNVATYTGAAFGALTPVTSYDGLHFGALNNVDVLKSGSANANWGVKGQDGNFTQGFVSDNLTLVTINESNYATNGYVAVTKYTIKNMGYDADVYVKGLTVTKNSADAALDGDLLKAIRVSVQILTTDETPTQVGAYIYNPNDGSLVTGEGAGKYTPAQGDTPAKWELSKTEPTYGGSHTAGYSVDSNRFATLTANTDYTVLVYVWIEGQDTMCTSENVDVSKFDVEIKFAAATPLEEDAD